MALTKSIQYAEVREVKHSWCIHMNDPTCRKISLCWASTKFFANKQGIQCKEEGKCLWALSTQLDCALTSTLHFLQMEKCTTFALTFLEHLTEHTRKVLNFFKQTHRAVTETELGGLLLYWDYHRHHYSLSASSLNGTILPPGPAKFFYCHSDDEWPLFFERNSPASRSCKVLLLSFGWMATWWLANALGESKGMQENVSPNRVKSSRVASVHQALVQSWWKSLVQCGVDIL